MIISYQLKQIEMKTMLIEEYFRVDFLSVKIKYILKSKYISKEFTTELYDQPIYSLTVWQGTACWFFVYCYFITSQSTWFYYLSIW